MTQEQLSYLMRLIDSGQGFNSGYQPPSILDVPTGSAQLAPGTGPGGQGIRQSDVNQAIQTQPNVDVPPDIPAVSSPDMNQRFTDLMQLYTGDPSGFMASNNPAGQVPDDPYLPPAATIGSTPTTAPDLPPGLGGPGSYPADVTLPPGSGISIPSGDPLTFDDLTNLGPATGPGGTGNYPTSPDLTDPNRWEPTNQQVIDPQTGLPPPPATAVTDPSIIDPNDPNNNLTRGGVSMPLYPTSQDVFPPAQPRGLLDQLGQPTDWPATGQFFRDAAGHIVDAAGNIVKDVGQFLNTTGQHISNFFTNNPIGYQPPPGTALGETGPLNEAVTGSIPGENLPAGLFQGLGNPITPPGSGAGVAHSDYPSSIGGADSWQLLMNMLREGEGFTGTPSMGSSANTSPTFDQAIHSNVPWSAGTWTPASAAYWNNVFSKRGYIFPAQNPDFIPDSHSGQRSASGSGGRNIGTPPTSPR